MDGAQFDALTRSISTIASRRTALSGVVGAALTAFLTPFRSEEAGARKHKKKKKKKSPTSSPPPQTTNCTPDCTGKVCGPSGCEGQTCGECTGGKECQNGACLCPVGTEDCQGTCIPVDAECCLRRTAVAERFVRRTCASPDKGTVTTVSILARAPLQVVGRVVRGVSASSPPKALHAAAAARSTGRAAASARAAPCVPRTIRTLRESSAPRVPRARNAVRIKTSACGPARVSEPAGTA